MVNVEVRFVRKENMIDEGCKISSALLKPNGVMTCPRPIEKQTILVPIVNIIATNDDSRE